MPVPGRRVFSGMRSFELQGRRPRQDSSHTATVEVAHDSIAAGDNRAIGKDSRFGRGRPAQKRRRALRTHTLARGSQSSLPIFSDC